MTDTFAVGTMPEDLGLLSNVELLAGRNHWRVQFDDGPGFSAAVDAADNIMRCEIEMRRRGMNI